jgi:hypothetical protein
MSEAISTLGANGLQDFYSACKPYPGSVLTSTPQSPFPIADYAMTRRPYHLCGACFLFRCGPPVFNFAPPLL